MMINQTLISMPTTSPFTAINLNVSMLPNLLNNVDSLVTDNLTRQNSSSFNQLPKEEKNRVEDTILLLLSFIAFIANFLVCLPIIMVPRIRTTINCFVMSLCLTQILTDCFVIPLYCFASQSIVYQFVVAFVVISYITNLLAMTLDRYFAIKFPLRYRGMMWRGRCIRVILACWLVSTFIQILPIFWYNSPYKMILQKVYLCIITVAFLLLPLCIVIFAYINIFIEILSSNQKEKERRVVFKNATSEIEIVHDSSNEHLQVDYLENERKLSNTSVNSRLSGPPSEFSSNTSLVRSFRKSIISKQQNLDFRMEVRSALIFFVIILMYGATWIPVLIMTVAGVFDQAHNIPKSMNMCAIYIMAANTMLDPLVYGLCMKDIRKHLTKILSTVWSRLMKNKNK